MFLKETEYQTLVTAAIESGLVNIDRLALLQGLPPGFVAGLRLAPDPVSQFQADLLKFNQVERLAGGIVPLAKFLENAAFQLRIRSLPQAGLFGRFANAIGNRTRGLPDAALPEPTQLPEVARKEAIVDRNDMVDFSFLSRGLKVGGSVARILVPKFIDGEQVFVGGGKPWLMTGTAWIIGPRLALTNLHVINARVDDEADASEVDLARQAELSILEFDYDFVDSVKQTIAVTALVAKSKKFDYALLRTEEVGRPALALNGETIRKTATTYMAVNIIQHPRGEPKRIAFRNNLVSGADDEVIRYFTDTDYGSSGSAVCDDNWRVVALHRGAKPADGVAYQGKNTAYVNFGSQIQAILSDLKAQRPDAHKEITGG